MKKIDTSPNQKIITINREKCAEPFVYMTKENMVNAYKDINATALYLYMLLASNKDKYQFALSPKAILNQYGMPVSTCQDQVKKLIDKGYLIQRKEGSNLYDFYEIPPDKKKFNY
ncbi:MAG: hypothetical protein ACI4MS_00455 [Candidatus Coproplasma sp.]